MRSPPMAFHPRVKQSAIQTRRQAVPPVTWTHELNKATQVLNKNWAERFRTFSPFSFHRNSRRDGAGGETRTLMSVTSPDFESGAYTNFATPAWAGQAIIETPKTTVNFASIGKNARQINGLLIVNKYVCHGWSNLVEFRCLL